MLTRTQIHTLNPRERTYNEKCGTNNGLILEVTSLRKGGTKCFVGRSRHRGKQVSVYVGTFGKEHGQFSSTSEANEAWLKIKNWSKETGRNPNDFKRQEKLELLGQKTLGDAVDGFLKDAANDIKETTHKEYTNKLNNQVLGAIDPNTPLKDLEWDNGGRGVVMKVLASIHEGHKFDLANRCQSLLTQTFNYAIDHQWMARGQNPAIKESKNRNRHQTKHHPTIEWNEVPALLKAVNLNKPNAQVQVVLATKLLLMTFLRTGALTRLEWDWIDWKKELITISGTTSGLKRNKDVNDHIDHLVPLTKQIKELLLRAQEFSSGKRYVFQPQMQSKYGHLNPSAPNNYLRSLGYKGVLRAHGWRRNALGDGKDVIKADTEVIQRQMGHLPKGKVLKAYDTSLLLDERRTFLEDWCDALTDQGLKI